MSDFFGTAANHCERIKRKEFQRGTDHNGNNVWDVFLAIAGFILTPDLAVQQLQSCIGTSTVLAANSNKDLMALLGGLNPYSIMNLDPAKSQALYVSGWGLDGKGEAILYVTQRPDGKYYWYSVLIAPTGFVPPLSPVTLKGPYAVIGVGLNDVLNIRSQAGASNPSVGSFTHDATNVMSTGQTATADNATWWEVQNPSGGTGWVNSTYLTEYVTHDAFCTDARITALIEQLKGSINQSNGDMFASLIGAKNGVAINFWRDVSPINYTNVTARSIFSDTTVYNWGTGPAAGSTGTSGTFAQVVQPDMVDVFNSNYQLGCDNPSYAAMFSNAWSYTNIHFYSITKPPTSTFDWKVWLVGFEYVDGVPYLYSTVH